MNDSTNDKAYRKKLWVQLRNSYGKLVYSYTTHNKMCDMLIQKNKILKVSVIISSSVSSFGFLGTVINNTVWLNALSGIFSFITLALTIYSKEENITETVQKHKETVDEMWLIREDYISLLTDFDKLSVLEIKEQRQELKNRLSLVYKKEPRTDSKAYNAARKFIKDKEGQYFKTEEKDQKLPDHLKEKHEKI